MEQINQQVETHETKHESHVAQRIIQTIFILLEVILAFRLIFKLLGANPDNLFVKGIYTVTQFMVGIFAGIFTGSTAEGDVARAIFEPATLIAMVVIAVIFFIVLKLVKPRSSKSSERTEYTVNSTQGK